MPRVTIGVPVYNAESLLEQCLENLAAQTFKDLKVIVLDNASIDGTGEIAERFAARDPRFLYRRQPENRGARQNFVDVLAMADTPYFMWRADDDRSDVNFVEKMVGLLDANAMASLAVGLSVLDKRGRRRRKRFPPQMLFEPKFSYRARLMFAGRAAWMFGLFRTERLKSVLARVVSNYPHVYGFDYLVLLPYLVTMQVVGSNETRFVTGFVERPTSGHRRSLIDPAQMAALRHDFLKCARSELDLALAGSWEAPALRTLLPIYAERTYRWAKIQRARLRVATGEKPFGATTKYD